MSSRFALAVPLVAAVFVLSACTGTDAEDSSADLSASSAETAEGNSDPSAADAGASVPAEVVDADVVMAQQTVDTPSEAGGALTATLRTVEVRDEVTTIRYAIRWDADDAEDDATEGHFSLGIGEIPHLVDTEALVQYRPFCTNGSWQGGVTDQQQCAFSATVSPRFPFDGFLNGATIDGWAQLPAPEGEPTTLDVSIGEGLPVFTGATVTYAEAQE